MKKHLLLVEDNKIDAFRITEALGQGAYKTFKVVHFELLCDALNWLKENNTELVLLDLGLPDSVDTETYMTFATEHPFKPVIILSSTDNYDIGIEAIKNGAQDFIEKERLEPVLLERSISKSLERMRLLKEVEKAKHDALKNSSKLRSVIDNSQNTIWLVDTNLRLEAFNRKFARSIFKKTGVIPQIGESLNENVHINNFGSWRFLYNRALAGEQFTETRKYNINDRDYYAEFTFVPVRHANGMVTGISVSARDITNKRRMMALLEAEKQVLAEQATGTSFELSFTNLINNIERLGHGMSCAIMLCKQPNNVLHYLAAPNLPKAYVAKTNGICSVPEKINHPIVMNGPTTTKLEKMFTAGWDSMRATAKTYDFETVYSYPILSSKNKPLGCINSYYKPGQKQSKLDLEIIERVKILAAAIIEKKIADETLAANEKRFRALTEKSTELILLLDEKANISYASSSVTKCLGFRPGEMMEESLMHYASEDEYQDILRKINRIARKTDASVDIELLLSTKKGQWRRFEGKATNALSDPSVKAIILNLSDITDEYQARRELNLREQALEASSNGKIIINSNEADMPVIYGNMAFFDMSGYTEADVLHKRCTFLVGADTDPQAIENIYAAIMNKGEFRGEMLCYRKNGTTFWCYITIAPVLDEKNELMYYIANLNDITALKDTEIKLRQKNDELNTFVYKATHDLKGPLASILGLSQLANDDIKDPDALRYINYIRDSTARLDMILNDLLRISMVTHVNPTFKRVNLEKLVSNIARNVNSSNTVDIMTRINVEGDLVTDETLLTSALHNLIDNAVKYKNTRAIQPYAMIEAHNYKDGVAISISDNGCGTPKEMQGKIFDMFFRGNDRSTGSGLGLYMVKKAVEKLQGDINFTSEVGVGSVFTLYLPSLKQSV